MNYMSETKSPGTSKLNTVHAYHSGGTPVSDPYKSVGETIYCRNIKELDCDQHPQFYKEVNMRDYKCECGKTYTKIVEWL
jgi:hypothetical protein